MFFNANKQSLQIIGTTLTIITKISYQSNKIIITVDDLYY